MKIMHLGDLHIGKKVKGFSMIEDQKIILEQIKAIVKENNVSCVMIAGDIYDKNTPSVEAVTVFDKFLTDLVKMNLKVLIISGNHDSVERLSFASSIMEASSVFISRHISEGLKKVTLEDEYGKINFYMMPFVRPVDVRQLYPDEKISDYNQAVQKIISEISLDTSERNIMLAHQFITNADTSDSELLSVGGLDNVDAENFRDFDYTALGHIHKPQKISDKIRYSGSILKYSFSEIKINKSVPIIDIKEKGNIEISLIPLKPHYEMIEIKGKYNELMSPDFYKNIDRESYVYGILTDETAEPDAVNKLRSVYKNIMGVEYDNITTEEKQVVQSSSMPLEINPIDFVKGFYNEMYNKSMNREQEEYIRKNVEKVWG